MNEGPSALDAAQRAIEHTQRQLFPFRFERWLVLGCVAFLDQCGRRSGMAGINVPGGPGGWGGGGGPGEGDLANVVQWFATHAVIVAAVAAAVLTIVIGFMAIVLWLNSRGVFMYVDNVASGRADFERPWREHAAPAASYFAWSFGLALATLVGFLLLLAAGVMAVVALVSGPRGSGLAAGLGLAAIFVVFLGSILVASLASVALHDFVAPLQIRARVGCGAGIRLLLALVQAHPGAFVIYVLLKILFSVVAGMVLVVAACFTCCCALLPVVMQTALQPLFYFERAWPLFLLRQLGYDLVADPAKPA
jgi:hypothetical protein